MLGLTLHGFTNKLQFSPSILFWHMSEKSNKTHIIIILLLITVTFNVLALISPFALRIMTGTK